MLTYRNAIIRLSALFTLSLFVAAFANATTLTPKSKLTPNVSISISPSSPQFGDSIAITVAVTGSADTPTGVAQVDIDGTPGPLGLLDTAGKSVISTVPSKAGPLSISVLYSGDGEYAAASSSTTDITVEKATPSVTAALDITELKFGEAFNISGTVTSSVGTPTGKASVLVDGSPIDSQPLASFAYPGVPETVDLDPGTHNVALYYEGDDNFNAVSSSIVVLTADQQFSQVAIDDPAPVYTGRSFTASCTVSSTFSVQPHPPTGTVKFYFDSPAGVQEVPLDGAGKATTTLTPDSTTTTLFADYSGDTDYQPSASNRSLTVLALPLTADVTVTPSDVVVNEPYSYSVKLTGTFGPVPDGTNVNFVDPGSGIALSSGVTTNGIASASDTVSATTPGTYNIEIQVPGYDVTTTTGASVNVNPVQTEITANPDQDTVPYGSTVVFYGDITVPYLPAEFAAQLISHCYFDVDNGSDTITTSDLIPQNNGIDSLIVGSTVLEVGTHTIIGNCLLTDTDSSGAYLASVSAPFTVTVTKATPTIGITSSIPHAVVGQTSVFSIDLTNPNAGNYAVLPATGNVSVYLDDRLVATKTLDVGSTTCLVGFPTTGSHVVKVTYAGDSVYDSTSATYTEEVSSLNLNSLQPSSVLAGLVPLGVGSDLTLTMTGAGFQRASGSTPNATVRFDFGTLVVDIVADTVSSDGATLTVKLPSTNVQSAGSATVTVINTAAGTQSGALTFSVGTNPAPIISGVTPASINVGGDLSDPAFPYTTLKIAGRNFLPGALVTVGGIDVDVKHPGSQQASYPITSVLSDMTSRTGTSVPVVDDAGDLITVQVPNSVFANAGKYDVTVTNVTSINNTSYGYGSSTRVSPPASVTVDNAKPVITNITPDFAVAGSITQPNSLVLSITGGNFDKNASVYVGGSLLTAGTVVTPPARIDALVPASLLARAAALKVTVSDPQPDGTAITSDVATAPILAVNPVYAQQSYGKKGILFFSTPYDYTGRNPFDVLGAASFTHADGTAATFTAGQSFTGSTATTSLFVSNTATILGKASIAQWDPTTGKYVIAKDGTSSLSLQAGGGYWALNVPDVNGVAGGILSVTQAGQPAQVTPFPISLHAGWNMCGDPYPGTVAISALFVQRGAQVLPFAQAVSQGWVGAVLWSYDGTQYLPNYADSSKLSAIVPYVGYWVFADVDCQLLVPRPQ